MKFYSFVLSLIFSYLGSHVTLGPQDEYIATVPAGAKISWREKCMPIPYAIRLWEPWFQSTCNVPRNLMLGEKERLKLCYQQGKGLISWEEISKSSNNSSEHLAGHTGVKTVMSH